MQIQGSVALVTGANRGIGEAIVNAPMDRTVMERMTMEQFRRHKAKEDAAEEAWRRAHGWPPRFRVPLDVSND